MYLHKDDKELLRDMIAVSYTHLLIVGNFLGSNALAAVSSSGNLIFLIVGFINGIAMGAGVVIARYYGCLLYTSRCV